MRDLDQVLGLKFLFYVNTTCAGPKMVDTNHIWEAMLHKLIACALQIEKVDG